MRRVSTLVVAMVAAAALLAVTARQLVTAAPQRMELRKIVITLARQPPPLKEPGRVPCIYDWYDDHDAPDCDEDAPAVATAIIENDPLWTLGLDDDRDADVGPLVPSDDA